MIQASDFIDRIGAHGYDFFAAGPCASFTPLVDTVIDAPGLDYLAVANEGDAVAAAAGHALAGRRAVALMSDTGLGNAVSPLAALTWAFGLPMLLVVSWQGADGDEPQPALLGRITPDLLDRLEVAWERLPEDAGDLEAVLTRAEAHMAETGRPYALIAGGRTFTPAEAGQAQAPSQSRGAITFRPAPRRTPRVTRRDALRRLVERTDETTDVIITGSDHAGRDLHALADRPNHLYLPDAAARPSMLGLGLALARPDLTVIVIEGDGGALTYMGAMATLGAYGSSNLCQLLLDNGCYESAGGQATVSAGLSFAAIAAATGYRTTYEGHDINLVDRVLEGSSRGPAFSHLHIVADSETGALPRPPLAPSDLRARFMRHIGAPG